MLAVGHVEPGGVFLGEAQQPFVAGEAVGVRHRLDDGRAGVVGLAVAGPVVHEPQERPVDGVEDGVVAGARVFEEHGFVEEVRTPGVVVFAAVVAGTVGTEVAVRLLERHRGADARGGLFDETRVAQSVGEARLAQGELAAHLGAPSDIAPGALAGIEVAGDVGLLRLLGLDFAQMPAHAPQGKLQLRAQRART